MKSKNMFDKDIYSRRRRSLISAFKKGILLFPGNPEAAMNYPANTYHFRQDSTFLYFFGIDLPNLAAVIDIDEGEEILFGDDFGIDDIIWMGPQPSTTELAGMAGVVKTLPFASIRDWLQKVVRQGRTVHFLPPYRGETKIQLSEWLSIPVGQLKEKASVQLVREVVRLRSVKDEHEIREIEKAVEITREMHITAMRMARPGIYEYEIAGKLEGIPGIYKGNISFPIILSINGQTLHNHYHGNRLKEGRILVVDAGAETSMHYTGDITRSIPVGGKFTGRQKDIYEIVENANREAIQSARPGITNLEQHLRAARIITGGLKEMGIMKGAVEEAVACGAHALFFPHGLGHMMGLDVHDMENLGEQYVGYDETISRSTQFGLASLRLARTLVPGFVLTIEPGIYFIPALIGIWKKEKKHADFINYAEVEKYLDFGGIRVEDNILITEDGARVLGLPIPKTVREIEEFMK